MDFEQIEWEDYDKIQRMKKQIEVYQFIIGISCEQPTITGHIVAIQRMWKKIMKHKNNSAIKIQARYRGCILRRDKFECECAIRLIHYRANLFLRKIQERKMNDAVIKIQRKLRARYQKVMIHPLIINELLKSKLTIIKRNEYLCKLIIRVIENNTLNLPVL